MWSWTSFLCVHWPTYLGDTRARGYSPAEEADGHLAELLAVDMATILTYWKWSTTKVHLSTEDSDSVSLTSPVPTACGFRVFRKAAVVETAENFTIGKHKPCDNCEDKLPDMIITFFANTSFIHLPLWVPGSARCGARKG